MRVAGRRHLLLPEMEGASARWYDRTRSTPSQVDHFKEQAARLTAALPVGARVLEVAPGPGHHAIEMARLGFAVTGLDISRTMVEIAHAKAARAGVSADFQLGDATSMPFPDGGFDLVVCQAAFKNFRQPVAALDEMHRVLRPGGAAVIQDLRRDAGRQDIAAEVRAQGQGRVGAFFTALILDNLRRRAYTDEGFRRLAAASAFKSCEVTSQGVGLEVRLTK